MTSKVCVLGSINMDVVVHVERFPQAGETLTGLSCDLMPSGKGANQAIAVANIGVPVDLIGVLGSDEFGKLLCGHLTGSDVNIDGVAETESSSGTAIVTVDTVDKEGKNRIVIVSRGNMLLQRKTIEQ